MSVKILEIVDYIFRHLCPDLLCLATERLLSKDWTLWIHTGFDYGCNIISNLKRVTADINLIQTPFPGHLSKVWFLSLDQCCDTRNSRSEHTSLLTLKRKASENSLALEEIWKVLHSSCCRAGSSHSCVALYRGAGTSSDVSDCLPEQFCLQCAHQWLATNITLLQVIWVK